jgi:hypothetical protein
MTRRDALLLFFASLTASVPASVWAADESRKVTIYKDPQCSCCEGYADYLRGNGFAVSVVATHDLPLLNEKHGVPTELQGCHLSLIGGYFIGGHVPVGIVNRLLSEKPAIAGITLPGMPEGSPGMTGKKAAAFTVYAIGKGSPQVYAVE